MKISVSSYVWSFVDNELKSLPWFRRIEFVKRARFSADQVASLLSHSKNIVWQRKLGPIAARVAVDVIRSNDLQVRTVKVVTEMALQGKRIDLLEITLRQSGLNQMMQHLLVNTLTSKLTWNELFDRVSDLDTDPNVIQMIRQRAESLLRHLPLDQIQFTFNLKWNDNDLVYMRSYSNQSNRFNMGDWKTIFQQFRQNTAQNYLDQNHQLSLSNGFSLILSLNGMVQNVHRFDPNQQFIQK